MAARVDSRISKGRGRTRLFGLRAVAERAGGTAIRVSVPNPTSEESSCLARRRPPLRRRCRRRPHHRHPLIWPSVRHRRSLHPRRHHLVAAAFVAVALVAVALVAVARITSAVVLEAATLIHIETSPPPPLTSTFAIEPPQEPIAVQLQVLRLGLPQPGKHLFYDRQHIAPLGQVGPVRRVGVRGRQLQLVLTSNTM